MVIVILFWQITLVIYKMINPTRLCGIDMREIFEVKAFFLHLLPTDIRLSFDIQFFQYVMVARQDTIDVPNHIDLLVGLFVVVAVAARVATEFLIQAAYERLTAIEAFSLFVHIC